MFKFINTNLEGAIIIEPQLFGDERGFFMESYNKLDFQNAGIEIDFVQDNHSKSKAGVLRGLHFQTQNTQSKLVRVINGSVYDVIVDLRGNSKTFGNWFGIILTAENKKQLLIPKGFAHGFLTLEDDTEFVYKCDDYYNPIGDSGIIWNDIDLSIDWEKYYDITNLTVSEKDKNRSTLKEFEKINQF
ncbi:MAG: dTDP-4-dehydrorhamnose 3,5-epimerase [Candidatus Gracilibacteria bacterium]|nr:dTDP-4-dehydrorhamnose 3,5-epimerase [Candidatus Gracilibacteria bacterium]